jgi:hypothetical protein
MTETTPSSVPVLIFAPGLGHLPHNAATEVADVIAAAATTQKLGSFKTDDDQKAADLPGLLAGKTVSTSDGKPVLQVYELDYRRLLDPPASPALPNVVPGMFRGALVTIIAAKKLVWAWRQPAKGRRAKFQLYLGLGAVGLLALMAVVSVYSGLAAAGVDPIFGGAFGDTPSKLTFGVTALGVTFTWAKLRKKLLAMAAAVDRFMKFASNEAGIAADVVQCLDAAVDGLRETDPAVPVHLLGYSFGSLALFDGMHPRDDYGKSNRQVGERVASLTTIGCPLDLVRMYYPHYCDKRTARNANLTWNNIFKEADIFSSNLANGSDDTADAKDVVREFVPGKDEKLKLKVTSREYNSESLNLLRIAAAGRLHSGYWSDKERSSCFEQFVDTWIPTTSDLGLAQSASVALK